jgi:hypothetical protein
MNMTPTNYQLHSQHGSHYQADLARTRKLETERRYCAERRESILLDVVAMEVQMGISTRWQPTTPEYMDTMKKMTTQKYRKASNELQRLVVQRLFELHKLNISQTGQLCMKF